MVPLIVGKSINHVVVGMAYSAGEKQMDDTLLGVYIGRSKEEVDKLILREANANAAVRSSVYRFKKAYPTIEDWHKNWQYIVYMESETAEVTSSL